MKQCKECKQTKMLSDYTRGRAVCKKCYAAKNRAKYQSEVSIKCSRVLPAPGANKTESLISIVIQDGKDTLTFNSEIKPSLTFCTSKQKITVLVENLITPVKQMQQLYEEGSDEPENTEEQEDDDYDAENNTKNITPQQVSEWLRLGEYSSLKINMKK